eukprot:CAMPEP_0201542808 /NCGR_PEP_ID=MMETSP0161_2-20130828/72235_1 /ASSEMBLY_ACC=CAM_ASM_000251 /TAXON_ID=180227 /ORGANISM="Neoparamoeba aestuarina, Strain SoJaBio B1-5/56/2" /LENGTH=133 /DNA_ID=CAMNT_0047950489 /DNA_START=248 /DNA_END=650 /DNA_ORIENTATION=+
MESPHRVCVVLNNSLPNKIIDLPFTQKHNSWFCISLLDKYRLENVVVAVIDSEKVAELMSEERKEAAGREGGRGHPQQYGSLLSVVILLEEGVCGVLEGLTKVIPPDLGRRKELVREKEAEEEEEGESWMWRE